MTAELRHQILVDPSSDALNATARAARFENMIDDGVARVRAGLTTIEEVLRVAG